MHLKQKEKKSQKINVKLAEVFATHITEVLYGNQHTFPVRSHVVDTVRFQATGSTQLCSRGILFIKNIISQWA